jgi:8-oxo-dGTP pyrophosphatase MutT (NUDIX family)
VVSTDRHDSMPAAGFRLHPESRAAEILAPAPGRLDRAVDHLTSAIVPQHQEPLRDRILEFCDRHDDALLRTCLEGHLTASAFAVDMTTRSVALIRHRKLGVWLQPGGHADGEGNLLLVAVNEIAEETGLQRLRFALPAFDLDIHAIPARGLDPEHLHLDLRFVAVVEATPPLSGNAETIDADWVPLDDPRMFDGDAVAGGAMRAVELAEALVAAA